MAGYSKEKHDATQEDAMRLIQSIGVSRFDELEGERREKAWKAICHLFQALADVAPETARRHVAKAARRQRHPDWRAKNESGWGGYRPGAGRKSGESEE